MRYLGWVVSVLKFVARVGLGPLDIGLRWVGLGREMWTNVHLGYIIYTHTYKYTEIRAGTLLRNNLNRFLGLKKIKPQKPQKSKF